MGEGAGRKKTKVIVKTKQWCTVFVRHMAKDYVQKHIKVFTEQRIQLEVSNQFAYQNGYAVFKLLQLLNITN